MTSEAMCGFALNTEMQIPRRFTPRNDNKKTKPELQILNFGSQKVGTKSAPQNVTVTNTGSTTVNVTSVQIAGNNSKDYSETNTCGSQIGPGGSCTISVTFGPTNTGIRNADAQISDTGGGSTQQVQLKGTGT